MIASAGNLFFQLNYTKGTRRDKSLNAFIFCCTFLVPSAYLFRCNRRTHTVVGAIMHNPQLYFKSKTKYLVKARMQMRWWWSNMTNKPTVSGFIRQLWQNFFPVLFRSGTEIEIRITLIQRRNVILVGARQRIDYNHSYQLWSSQIEIRAWGWWQLRWQVRGIYRICQSWRMWL